MKKQSVLFLCTGNSARSQMAEALLKQKAGNAFNVFSAGTNPEGIDERTINALTSLGISSNGLSSKSLDVFKDKHFDYVITLCEKASTECRSFSNAKKQLDWDFTDPKKRAGSQAFLTTLHEINDRLAMFLLIEQAGNLEHIKSTIDPITFYKSLTDDIRLKTLMLTHYHGELCVCELMQALAQDSQPKVSRNLAVLKKANIISDRRHGQWIFYRINPALAPWAKSVIAQTTQSNIPFIKDALTRLDEMNNRPNKTSFCR